MLRLMARPVRAHASGVATRVTQRGCVRAVDEDDGPAMSFYHLVADATLDGVQVSHLARARAPRYGDGPCRGCARARRRCSTSSRTCIIPSSRRTARSALRPTPRPALPPALCARRPHLGPHDARSLAFSRSAWARRTNSCSTSKRQTSEMPPTRPIRTQTAPRRTHFHASTRRTPGPARAIGGGCVRLVRAHETHARRFAGSCGSPRPSAVPSATTSTRPLHHGSTTATATDYCRRWRTT